MRSPDETTILITGATDGLGRGVAERLAAAGATLHLHGRDPERLSATADAIRQSSCYCGFCYHRAEPSRSSQHKMLPHNRQFSSSPLNRRRPRIQTIRSNESKMKE